jgi:hypothetical protein
MLVIWTNYLSFLHLMIYLMLMMKSQLHRGSVMSVQPAPNIYIRNSNKIIDSRKNNLFTFFANFCIGRPLCLYTLGFLNHWLCAMFYEFDIWFRICSDSGIFVFYLLIDVVSSVRGRVYMIFDMISRDLHM